MAIAPGSVFPRNGVPADQAAPGADPTARATCDELFYKSSCNPRFDPQSMNSIISELVNAVNHNCDGSNSGVDWDCSVQNNLLLAICRLAEDALHGCLSEGFPDIGDICGDPQYMVLINDGDCLQIGTYSPAGAPRAQGLFRDAQPTLAPDTAFVVPQDFPNANQVYVYTDLQDDVLNETVNESVIVNSMLTKTVFTLECPTRFNVETVLDVAQPADVGDAYNQRMRVGYRYRVDGGDWTYPLTANQYLIGQPVNGLESTQNWTHGDRVYPAGEIEFQTFYVSEDGRPLLGLNARTFEAGGGVGVPTPRTVFRPAL